MRRFVQTLSVFALVGFGAATAVAGSAEKAEKDVRAALETVKQGMLKKDRALLASVYHPDLRFGHSNGKIENKAEAIEHVATSTATYDAVDWPDTEVQVRGNVAVATGKMNVRLHHGEQKEELKLVVLTVWLKGAHGWQMVARQATRPKQPPPSKS